MFISKVEKDYLMDSVIRLQEEVRLIKAQLTNLSQPVIAKDTPKAAPYGLKKDGTPKQRPGRKPARRRA